MNSPPVSKARESPNQLAEIIKIHFDNSYDFRSRCNCSFVCTSCGAPDLSAISILSCAKGAMLRSKKIICKRYIRIISPQLSLIQGCKRLTPCSSGARCASATIDKLDARAPLQRLVWPRTGPVTSWEQIPQLHCASSIPAILSLPTIQAQSVRTRSSHRTRMESGAASPSQGGSGKYAPHPSHLNPK